MLPDDDDATQPVEVTPDAPISDEVTPEEIEDLRAGYERNRRRSRLGLIFGAVALVAILAGVPAGIVVAANQSKQNKILDELSERWRLEVCRDDLDAAHIVALGEWLAAIHSRPMDMPRVDAATGTLNRIAALRLDTHPCAAAQQIGSARVGPLVAETPTTTTAPPPGSSPAPTTTRAATAGTTVTATTAAPSPTITASSTPTTTRKNGKPAKPKKK